jgi:ParB-like chromosome segregation protein Spo0J
MKTSSIEIPEAELIDVEELQLDGENPNKMKKNQLQALRKAIKRWGFIVPIVTNRDLLVADGEQRITVAKELGMKKVPVVRLDVEDVDRRLLRQVLNKLKGQHVKGLDLGEYEKIIDAGREDDLKEFLLISEADLEAALGEEESIDVENKYELIIEFDNEEEQKGAYLKLTEMGYKCKVLIL